MSMSLKYPHQFCTIFGTIEHCDILNMPVTSLSSLSIDATWQKTKNSLFSYYKTDFVEPFLLPGSVQNPNVIKKIDFMNIILSFKDLFDLSIVLCKMHSRYDVTICWCFTLVRLSACLGGVCRSNCQQVQCLLLFKQTVDGIYLPAFQYIAAVDSAQQFLQTSSAKPAMLNSR